MVSLRQQEFGTIEARLNAKLLWGQAKHCRKLPNEMKRRNLNLSRDICNGEPPFLYFLQKISSVAEPTKCLVFHQHGKL
jgi:hypothetical protein